MKAIGKYIVIKEIKLKDTSTKGGLLLSEYHREDVRYKQAEVIKPGTEVKAIKTKDIIYYDKVAGFNIEINKEQYKVIKESDVVVII